MPGEMRHLALVGGDGVEIVNPPDNNREVFEEGREALFGVFLRASQSL